MMKKLIMRICGLVGAVMFFINCSERKPVAYNSLVHEYGNILPMIRLLVEDGFLIRVPGWDLLYQRKSNG
jgi:hypothetical protein